MPDSVNGDTMPRFRDVVSSGSNAMPNRRDLLSRGAYTNSMSIRNNGVSLPAHTNRMSHSDHVLSDRPQLSGPIKKHLSTHSSDRGDTGGDYRAGDGGVGG